MSRSPERRSPGRSLAAIFPGAANFCSGERQLVHLQYRTISGFSQALRSWLLRLPATTFVSAGLLRLRAG